MKHLRVGSDIDDTICSWYAEYEKRFGSNNPDHLITYHVENILRKDREFWVNLPVINRPDFELTLYCTKRVNPKSYTKEFIKKNNLPDVPVYQQYCQSASKAPLIKGRVDVFIEDSVRNFLDLNRKGIPCLLIDSPYNQSWGPVGRIFSLDYYEIEDAYELFIKTMFKHV